MNRISTLFIVFLLVFISNLNTLNAQCTATAASNGSDFRTAVYSGGSYNWNDPSNVATKNGSSAKASATLSVLNGYTEYLKVSGFNFNIPAFSSICGVSVSITRSASGIGLGSNVNDNTVKLVVDGAVVGNNKAKSTEWSNASTTVNYGGPTDVWGLSLTANNVNNLNFGVAFSADLAGLVTLLPSANIDNITITVYYNSPANITLPLILSRFQSSLYGSTVRNNWIMAEQEANAGITIQRKKDLGEWTNLQTYENLKGGTDVSYQHQDELQVPGNYFYRLKFTSVSGTVSYSKTNSVVYASQSKLQVFPIPAQSQITITNANTSEKITVCNSMGQQLNLPVQWVAKDAANLNVAGLTSGLYFLRNGNNTITFVKQ